MSILHYLPPYFSDQPKFLSLINTYLTELRTNKSDHIYIHRSARKLSPVDRSEIKWSNLNSRAEEQGTESQCQWARQQELKKKSALVELQTWYTDNTKLEENCWVLLATDWPENSFALSCPCAIHLRSFSIEFPDLRWAASLVSGSSLKY